MDERRDPWTWATRVALAILVLIAVWPHLRGLSGVLGLDLANYGVRIWIFAQAWSAGAPLPELTRWSGCGEPFVLYNGSLASCLAGGCAWILGGLGAGSEQATAWALRGAYVLCDGGSVLLAFLALRWAGVGRAGALVGAAGWGLGWLRRGESIHAANLEHAAFLALLPLAAGLLARVVRRPHQLRRPLAGLGLVLAFLVPVHPGLALIFGVQLALAVGLAIGLKPRARHDARRLVGALLLSGAVAALATAWFSVQLLAERAEFGLVPFPIAADPDASLLDYLNRSLWFADRERYALSPSNYLSSAYAGLSLFALALVGLALPGARRRVAAALALALGSALVSLHPAWTTALFGEIYGLASIRFAAPAFLWLVVAAALGADRLCQLVRHQRRGRGHTSPIRRPALVACLSLTALVAADFGFLTRDNPLYEPQTNARHPLSVGVAAGLAPLWEQIARLERDRAEPRIHRVLGHPHLEQHQGVLVHGLPLADGLERHGWRPGARAALDRARGAVEQALRGEPTDLGGALDALAIRYVTILDPGGRLPPRLPGLVRRALAPPIVALYERDGPTPAFVLPGGAARLIEERDRRIRLEVTRGGAALELRRQFHPRWRARFGDADLPVRESARGMMTVDLPAGSGELVLTHAPWPGRVPAGLLSLLALLALGFGLSGARCYSPPSGGAA